MFVELPGLRFPTELFQRFQLPGDQTRQFHDLTTSEPPNWIPRKMEFGESTPHRKTIEGGQDFAALQPDHEQTEECAQQRKRNHCQRNSVYPLEVAGFEAEQRMTIVQCT